MERVDAVVVGAGFGGLGAALHLAEAGLRVVVCESLDYPGGCAGTFTRGGARFEAGATLAMGVGPGEVFHRILARRGLSVPVQRLDPVVELRVPRQRVQLPSGRDGLAAVLRALPDIDPRAVDSFAREVQATADALRPLLQDPGVLPPLTMRGIRHHLSQSPAYLPLLRQIGRPLSSVLRRHGLERHAAVRRLLEPLCWVTVQTGIDEAEAPFALGAIDTLVRSAHHVHGGMGALAAGLADAIRAAGGQIRFTDPVRSLRPDGLRWQIGTRRGTLEAPLVFANLLPQGLMRLADLDTPPLRRLTDRVRTGWGAAMLYLQVDGRALPDEAFHLDLCADPAAPYRDGNHVFCSVSAAGEQRTVGGLRTVVASTHLELTHGPPTESRTRGIQQRIGRTLASLAPELWSARREVWPASPRTFARFTSRERGFVGGIPRRAGLRQYLDLFPGAAAPGLYLVGDSVGLGQSTLAAALSGMRIAALASDTAEAEDRLWRGSTADDIALPSQESPCPIAPTTS